MIHICMYFLYVTSYGADFSTHFPGDNKTTHTSDISLNCCKALDRFANASQKGNNERHMQPLKPCGGEEEEEAEWKRGLFASVHWRKHRMAAKWVTTAKQSTRVSKKHILTKADADASPSRSLATSLCLSSLLMLCVCPYVHTLLSFCRWLFGLRKCLFI